MGASMSWIEALGNTRGMALLLAVTVVSLLIAVTLQFNKDMRQELVGSTNVLEVSALKVMIQSGQNLAYMVLEEDGKRNDFDSVHDSWSMLDKKIMEQMYGSEELKVSIEDLSGRLPINSLVGGNGKNDNALQQRTRDVLQRLLIASDYIDSGEKASLVIGAIIDWMDADNNEQGLEETESSYYRKQSPPYSCSNRPLEFVEELLRIRYVTEEMYYGNEDNPGLRDLVTVHGDQGTININTAPGQVLAAMSPAMNDELADELIVFREEPENRDRLKDKTWYAELLPGDVQFENEAVTTESAYFRINVTAQRHTLRKTLSAVVYRQKDNTILLQKRKIE